MTTSTITALTAKTAPVTADVMAIDDSEASNATKKVSLANLHKGLSTGISNAQLVKIDDASVADDDYARFTASGVEGRTPLQVRGDLNEVNAQTDTTYTTVDGDDGKVITLNNAAAITLTVHQAAPAKFHCLIVQLGAGQVTVAVGGTGNLRNYYSHTKLAGQYAMASLYVISNAGTAPEVYFQGVTA